MFEQAIEKKREKMKYLAKRYGITSQKTVSCSQELDKLLNVILLIQIDNVPTQHTNVRSH
ncbi:aspartyl-phosphate phosphatase Spo0E family protein [Bacillus cereus group sp. BfR-BA-01380]|uniref:aspartyl-phosphate phosphatase Spo0E family protein n=1 Tax=Bacillus cereus group sp. BfR-BA-01380 TaxID=2920324 RepID=UPI001F5860B1|nr:aspartyl-phosphate phosphatase Spo0E family protein [Bacillus cereus group sp. BfR-BA-01380]